MTKDDFIQWRNNPVTQEAFEAIASAAEQAAVDIINRTTANIESDMYKRGFIRGIQEVIDWTPMFDPETKEIITDEIQDDGTQDTY